MLVYQSYQVTKRRNKNKWYKFTDRDEEEKVQMGKLHPLGEIKVQYIKFTTDKSF